MRALFVFAIILAVLSAVESKLLKSTILMIEPKSHKKHHHHHNDDVIDYSNFAEHEKKRNGDHHNDDINIDDDYIANLLDEKDEKKNSKKKKSHSDDDQIDFSGSKSDEKKNKKKSGDNDKRSKKDGQKNKENKRNKDIDYTRPDPVVSPDLKIDSSQFFVQSLPGLLPEQFPTRQWAGYIPVPFAGQSTYGNIFHWMFEPVNGENVETSNAYYENLKNNVDSSPVVNNITNKKPVLFWLNGGPGCSSMDGLFVENGPFRISDDSLNVNINPHSWHKYSWLIYLDQPVGTGFSTVNSDCPYCTYVQNQTAVNQHLYSVVQSILKLYPFLQDRKIFFSGESYAGHYLPSFADYALELNKHATKYGDLPLNIAGLAIGNGWSDPEVQYNFAQFAHNIGLISQQERDILEFQYSECRRQEEAGDFSGQHACSILQSILAASGPCPALLATGDDDMTDDEVQDIAGGGNCYGPIVNFYDVRSYYVDPGTMWPEGVLPTVNYLNRQDVKHAIHVDETRNWKECGESGANLQKVGGLGVVMEIERVLESKIPILFYNGQYDLVCNHLGTEMLLNQLQWSKADEFVSSDGGIWALRDSTGYMVPAGYLKATNDELLAFLTVIGGSHMVPMNVPEAADDMIRRFLARESFFDAPQPRLSDSPIAKEYLKNKQFEASQTGPSSPTSIMNSDVKFSLGSFLFIIFSVMIATGAIVMTVFNNKIQFGNMFRGRQMYVRLPQTSNFEMHSTRTEYQSI